MYTNGFFFARVARRITQKGQSLALPYLQNQNSKNRLASNHFSQSIESFPVKSLLLDTETPDDYVNGVVSSNVYDTLGSNGYSVNEPASFNLPFERGYISTGVVSNPSSAGYQPEVINYSRGYSQTNIDATCRRTTAVHSAFDAHLRRQEIELLPERDWNQEFNEVLESSALERADKLRKLENEFVAVAAKIGKIIISERNLSPEDKQISPASVRGIAGGEKFKVKGIFFKFAVGLNDLYGSDENAMKVACHELKGHTALVSCGMMHGLKLGLMTIIDYQGYRIVATSILPISDQTLVYGSSNGGEFVCTSLDVMNELMQKCGKVLNLKGHIAGINEKTSKFIYGPCDLEGHLGSDGCLYAIDLARLFPPETPEKSIPGSFLYRLLRPELVRAFPNPLSSDAFTKFGQNNHEIHDSEVRQASEFLHQSVIPNFCKYLNGLANNSTSHLILDDILVKLHRSGINYRYLGEVRSQITNIALRKTLLTEICTRVFKNEFRRRMRESTVSGELANAELCAKFLNTLFMNTRLSLVYWCAIKPKIHQKYSGALSESELRQDFDLRKHLHLDVLFKRLTAILGIEFTSETPEFPLSAASISQFIVKTKQMYTVPRIEADTAAELARTSKDINETRRLLSVARNKYYSVLELKPDDYVVLSNLGIVLAEAAVIETNPHERNMLFAEANEKLEASVRLKTDHTPSLVMWADVIINQVIYTEEASGDEALLNRAVELALQAESITSGVGALIIARASALQHRDSLVAKWLHHASATNFLPPPEVLANDPAFITVKNQQWFQQILDESVMDNMS